MTLAVIVRHPQWGAICIMLVKRAANHHGWSDVLCTVYGQEFVKGVKNFPAM